MTKPGLHGFVEFLKNSEFEKVFLKLRLLVLLCVYMRVVTPFGAWVHRVNV